MESNLKIAGMWLILAIAYTLHNVLHLQVIQFGIDVVAKDADGSIPGYTHVIHTVFETGTLVMALLTLFYDRKAFRLFTLIWALILLPVNLLHLAGTIAEEGVEDISQIVLLVWIIVVNTVLAVRAGRWKNAVPTHLNSDSDLDKTSAQVVR